MIRDAASLRQVEASDPTASTWLSANAGSGKTRVLTDRVARLLLSGVEPQRVLCLTYTKAAAGEMQNRLFRRLGDWAMLPDARLAAALAELGLPEAGGPDLLRRARRLFARAIETPGGLKIQTIHSFCASLLRRFPLEAGVTPQFVEIEERAARLLREEVVEDLASGPLAGRIEEAARVWTGEDFGALTDEIARRRDGFPGGMTRTQALDLFGLPAGATAERLIGEVFTGREAALVAHLVPLLAAGGKTDAAAGAKLAYLWLEAPDLATLAALEGVFLYGPDAKAPFGAKAGAFPTKAVRARFDATEDLDALMERVAEARPRRIALLAAEKTLALHRFADVFLPEYDRRKAARGWLDFDDLIRKAGALLTDRAAAQWVLFRLDGGIDHILVDEAQDTSPGQWRVIENLAQEFSAGLGAREGVARTIFVVGDKKQSIYSFQGADLSVFERMRASFRDRLAEVRIPLADLTLDWSFRSAGAVLRVVDATVAEAPGMGGPVEHRAFHAALPGRVDLWPLVEAGEEAEESAWYDPLDRVSAEDPVARLAAGIAAGLRERIEGGEAICRMERGPDGAVHPAARPLRAGDVLILLRRRSTLFHEIIRALKQAGLPVAGADRLKLAGETAIRDIEALLAFLVTPEDDLSLAAALRSPLLGWSEAALYELAHGRPGYLWEALRGARAAHSDTLALLDDLRAQADFLRPYELIERLLTRHGGRARLLARLGPEAEDGIDALLAQAQAYERLEVPSLAGFAGWLAGGEVEIKRQPDAAGGLVRVMTVHGAKGLEAPVVILPDTARRRPQARDELIRLGDSMVWATPAAASPPAVAEARAALVAARAEEDERLLYVAMTRAESWLIVCGLRGRRAGPAPTWHEHVAEGMAQAAADGGFPLDPLATPAGEGLRLHRGDWPAPGAAAAAEDAPAPRPDGWMLAHAPAAVEPPGPLAPSDLGGAKALAGEGGLDEETAKRRGTALHRLLEHLPLWPEAGWQAMGRDLLARADPVPSEAEMADLLDEAAAVLRAPGLGAIFAPGTLAEVEIAAPLSPEGPRILGTIDRLVIGEERILAVDFKSNAVIPARPEEVPDGILRQMGAYAAALSAIWPGRRIETAVLWTRSGVLMPLPAGLTAAALAAALP